MVIDDDSASLVQFDADLLETKAFGERYPADRDQDHVGLDYFAHAIFRRLDGCLEPLSRCVDRGNF
jgi:hypothetical protein